MKVQSITSNQIPYPESSLPGCLKANGERQDQNVRTLQKNCKGSTFTATESESVCTSSPQCNQWIPATITKTPVASQPRLYSVETTKGVQLVRNRCFIHPAQEIAPIPAESMKHGGSSNSK